MTTAELRTALADVSAEQGALVSCRDASSFEMLMRLSSSKDGRGGVSAIFHAGGEVTGPQRLFVAARYIDALENEIQTWLDPFKPLNVDEGGRKRSRVDSESSDDSFSEDSR